MVATKRKEKEGTSGKKAHRVMHWEAFEEREKIGIFLNRREKIQVGELEPRRS